MFAIYAFTFQPQGYSVTDDGVDRLGCSASGVYIMNKSRVMIKTNNPRLRSRSGHPVEYRCSDR